MLIYLQTQRNIYYRNTHACDGFKIQIMNAPSQVLGRKAVPLVFSAKPTLRV